MTITARAGGPWRIRNEVRPMENLPPGPATDIEGATE